jgi:glycosyltransferase involved in cell wall biosynthesis
VYDVPASEAATWTAPAKNALEWGKLLGWWVGSRAVFDDAAAILCLGPEEQGRVAAAHPGKRVVVLPNGVDPGRFARGDRAGFRRRWGIEDASRVLLTVGRIDVQKNQIFAVRAFAEIAASDPSLRLVLIGPVTSEAYRFLLDAAIRETGLGSRITVIPGLGHADLVDAFHGADVFLLPSTHEPFGIVVLEAWASGLPVLASRVGGIPSFVEDGRDGLLFEPGDLPGFLRAWRALDADAELGRALGAAGRFKAVNRFSWDAITKRLEALYEEVIRENPLRA